MANYLPFNHTASAALNRFTHSEAMNTVNAAAGLTLTLPAATGSGDTYHVAIGTTVTSNSVIIRVASGTDWFAGQAFVSSDNAADAAISFETATGALASRSDTITMNGTTTGGLAGDRWQFHDIGAGQWEVTGWMSGTGSEVTPFSAAVA
jgi:hypothetical protein